MPSLIDQETFNLMKNVELLCRNVVMAIEYTSCLNGLLSKDPQIDNIGDDFWTYCKNSCASMGITKWCSVFGSKKIEKTYWEKIDLLNKPMILNMILDQLNLTVAEWSALRDNTLKVRDKFIAHNDFIHSVPNIFKNLVPYKLSANILRDCMLDVFSSLITDSEESNRYLNQIILIPSQELEQQIIFIYEQGVRNANKLLVTDTASSAT